MSEPMLPTPIKINAQALIGLVLLIAAVIVRRACAIPDGIDGAALDAAKSTADMGGDIADILIAFGGPLVGWARSLPTIKPPGGGPGNTLTALLVGVGLGGMTLVMPGCAPREVVTADPISIEYWEGPPCRIQVYNGAESPYVVRNPVGSDKRCRIVGER